MDGKTKSYLALTALPAIGAVLLSSRPAWVFRGDGTAVLWANAAGAQALSAATPGALMDRRLGATSPLAGQIARLAKALPHDTARLEILKLSDGFSLTSVPAACRRLALDSGERAVLAVAAGASKQAEISTNRPTSRPASGPANLSPTTIVQAAALAEALAGDGGAAAVLDDGGGIVGTSRSFRDLGLDATVATLAEGVADGIPRFAEFTVDGVARPAGAAHFDAGGQRLTLVVVGPAEAAQATEEATPVEDTPTDMTALGIAPWRAARPDHRPAAPEPAWEDERTVAVSWESDKASIEEDAEPGKAREVGADDSGSPIKSGMSGVEVADPNKPAPVEAAMSGERTRGPRREIEDDDLDDAARRSIEQGSAGAVEPADEITAGPEPDATGQPAIDTEALAEWVAAQAGTDGPSPPDNIHRLPGATTTPGHDHISERFRRVSESLNGHGRTAREDRKLPSEGVRRPVGEGASGTSAAGEDHPSPPDQVPGQARGANAEPPSPSPSRQSRLGGIAPQDEEEGHAVSGTSAPGDGDRAENSALPDTSILDRLPMALVVFRDGETLYASPALTGLLGYDGLDDFIVAGGREVLFGDSDPVWARDEAGRTSGATMARTKDGGDLAVAARLQSVRWGGAPALMLTLREVDDHAGALRAPPSPSRQSRPGPHPSGQMPEGKPEEQASKDGPAEAVQGGIAPQDEEEVSGSATAQPAHTRIHELAELLAAKEARLSELEAILDTATDGVVVVNGDGAIATLNHSAEALFGIDALAVTGQPFTSLFAEESRRAARDYLDGLASNGVASVLNDGREVIGKVPAGGLIPLFMTMGRLGRTGKFCAVLRDITHWKNVEEELVAARRAAEAANSQKSDFLARISHEIRTPLNAIIGFSEVMMEERFGPVGNARYRDYLRDIHVSGTHIMSLINDLLDLSKIEAGKLELSFEAVAVNAVIQECVALMQPQANRGRIIIRTSLAAGLPPVVADQRSLRQILLNLLSNAIKFTNEGGQVIVSTAIEESGEVAIRVRDTGVGMRAEDIETALKPFRQLATSARERQGGTGLGLPLTKALVEANQAAFAIDSAVNQGTLVKITFPKARVVAG